MACSRRVLCPDDGQVLLPGVMVVDVCALTASAAAAAEGAQFGAVRCGHGSHVPRKAVYAHLVAVLAKGESDALCLSARAVDADKWVALSLSLSTSFCVSFSLSVSLSLSLSLSL
jgi:hypothetical protein